MGRIHREARAHAKFQRNLAIVSEQEQVRMARLAERQAIIDQREADKRQAEIDAKQYLLEVREDRKKRRAERKSQRAEQGSAKRMASQPKQARVSRVWRGGKRA
jgi:hypothetical protein